ncbi:MAG: hypothetical protein U1G08_12570 [Verrucomicrobiota bacterium]
MTVVADSRKCVLLPTVQPGERFELQIAGAGKFVLTRLESEPIHPVNVTIEQRGGVSVGILDRPIDEQALAEALNEFP